MTSSPQLEQLEARLCHLEDIHAITQIITFVGPAADSGHAVEFSAAWESDGVYRVGERAFEGVQQIHDVVATGPHQKYMERGCAHLMTPPHVVIDGDDATAVNYTLLVVRDPDTGQFHNHRASANSWTLTRRGARWTVTDRSIALLDGSAPARDLLAALFR